MDLVYLFTSLDGRINRAKYWIGAIAVTAVSVVGTLLAVAIFGVSDTSVVLMVLISLALFFPTYALMAKRFQDRDRPGRLALYALGAIYGANLIQTFLVDPGVRGPVQILCDLIVIGIGLWLLIELGLLKGTQGPNRYGPDPLGKIQADATL